MLSLASLLILAIAAAGRSGISGSEETTLAVYEAANGGDLENLESYYSEDLATSRKGSVDEMNGGTPGFADHLVRVGIVEDVEIRGVQQSGHIADVSIRVTYYREELAQRSEGELFPEDNPVKQGLPLVREDGSWKVSIAYLSEGE